MNKTGIFYGSSNGNTQEAAKRIAAKLGVDQKDIHDVASVKAEKLNEYDVVLLGSSTWGIGDLQDDWEGFIKALPSADWTGKKVALFGCGDSASYSDSFCDAVGKIYRAVKDLATVIGSVPTEGYTFDASEALIDNRFVGLLLDEENENHLSEQRIDLWISGLKEEL
ncbi:MAG: flavodoxin [Bacteroidales bacterium]|jgi:flavodoxin I|nr:flavodoxin [Bacteroidales bacterium]